MKHDLIKALEERIEIYTDACNKAGEGYRNVIYLKTQNEELFTKISRLRVSETISAEECFEYYLLIDKLYNIALQKLMKKEAV